MYGGCVLSDHGLLLQISALKYKIERLGRGSSKCINNGYHQKKKTIDPQILGQMTMENLEK